MNLFFVQGQTLRRLFKIKSSSKYRFQCDHWRERSEAESIWTHISGMVMVDRFQCLHLSVTGVVCACASEPNGKEIMLG